MHHNFMKPLFGERLVGSNPVVHIYCDEAGTSRTERFAVVVSVVINPYREYIRVEDEIRKACEVLPECLDSDFIFHAKDIANNRNINRRDGVLIISRWLDIIHKVGLPISISWLKKDRNNQYYGKYKATSEENFLSHSSSFYMSLYHADKIIEDLHPNDVATIFAEDCPQMRRALNILVSEFNADGNAPEFMSRGMVKIKNGISWVDKRSCAPLQLADAIAYSFQRYLNKREFGDYLKWAVIGKPQFHIGIDYTESNGGQMTIIPLTTDIS